MSLLEQVKGISTETYNNLTDILGTNGSGKTTLAGTFPKPLLYISIDNDGGGVVLKNYSDSEIKSLSIKSDEPGAPNSKSVFVKIKALVDELKGQKQYKTVVFDAYSSIEESMISYGEKVKGAHLTLQERGNIHQELIKLRDKIVQLSTEDVEYVLISHTKTVEAVDSTTGEKYSKIVPKMSESNANVFMEKASRVVYCCKKATVNADGTNSVKFLTYIGAHPKIDTKFRTSGKPLNEVGFYVENLTYDKLKEIQAGTSKTTEVKKENIIESKDNPFDETEEGE